PPSRGASPRALHGALPIAGKGWYNKPCNTVAACCDTLQQQRNTCNRAQHAGGPPCSGGPLLPSRHDRYAIPRIPRSAADGGGPVVLGYPQHLIHRPNVDGVAVGRPESVVVAVDRKSTRLNS